MLLVLTCAGSNRALAQTTFDLRWGGWVHDVFTIDGIESWGCEDGGRIRHRDNAGNWTFQTVPSSVKDTVRRIFFLPGTSGQQTGWAVASDGSVLKTTNSGSTWSVIWKAPAVLSGGAPFEDLYAVRFLDSANGWVVGLHGIWWTNNGGTSWNASTLNKMDGTPLTTQDVAGIEMYAIDVVPGTGSPPPNGIPIIGLVSSEPGLVFRSIDGRTWKIAWDIHDHCDQLTLPCELAACAGANFEAWDIEISRNPNPAQKLALMCGGIDFGCGMVWRSTDDGLTWTREPHECNCVTPPCTSCTLANGYNEDDIPGDTHLWRLKSMRTLYGLAINSADNSAVAVGYNGQQLWRNPATGVWEDRSEWNHNYLTVTNALVYPLNGVCSNGGNGSTGIAISSGFGGYIRRTTNGGQNWIDDTPVKGEPYRPIDISFKSASAGWMDGQFSRIAETGDAGTTWLEDFPKPTFTSPTLYAIAFAADNQRGVAVGGRTALDLDPGQVKLMYTLNAGGTPWNDSSNSVTMSGPIGALRDVTYVPSSTTVWAAGALGFVLRSQGSGGNGASWRQFQILIGSLPADTTSTINGVAFKDTTLGLFAGNDAGAPLIGKLWQVQINGAVMTWTLRNLDPMNPAATVADLGDVEITGNDAYAVGETTETGPGGTTVRKGIVLHASFSGGSFGGFTRFSPVDQFPACQVGLNLRGGPVVGPTTPVLNRIAFTSSGELWVAGECGRVWRYSSGAWTEMRSNTDTHITGVSFDPTPASSVGFFVGYRYKQTAQALVRVQ